MLLEKAGKSLQDLIDSVASLVDYLRNDTVAPHIRARNRAEFVPREFTNWRDEQRAWAETAVLFDQSHHMPELFLEGRDAAILLERLCINSFASFTCERAKQLVACTPRGHLIGDCIAYRHGAYSFELVSGMTLLNWVEFQAMTGGYQVEIVRDPASAYNPKGRRLRYRFQLEGPHTAKILATALGSDAPEIPFFHIARVRIRGCEAWILKHGMAGHGVEISGPFAEMAVVRQALLDAGRSFGLVQGGSQAYVSTIYESGWMAYPLAGIYTTDELADFRRWLPADGYEGNAQIGGSFVSDNIEDYYVTPWHLGYDRILKFDHDFIGRAALEAMPAARRRIRATLSWHTDDVLRVYGSQLRPGPRYKSIEFPIAHYGYPHFDEVLDSTGRRVGLSCHCGYTNNSGRVVSLAMLDADRAEVGTELSIVWGEPNGGSRKPHIERHVQTKIRAAVTAPRHAGRSGEGHLTFK